MSSRHMAAGASTPWYVNKCARGRGTSAASRARKSSLDAQAGDLRRRPPVHIAHCATYEASPSSGKCR